MDPKPYYLQEPRPSFWRRSDVRQCIMHSIDLALDNKDESWFMELTDRLLKLDKEEKEIEEYIERQKRRPATTGPAQ